jgi:hypothetical protein
LKHRPMRFACVMGDPLEYVGAHSSHRLPRPLPRRSGVCANSWSMVVPLLCFSRLMYQKWLEKLAIVFDWRTVTSLLWGIFPWRFERAGLSS